MLAADRAIGAGDCGFDISKGGVHPFERRQTSRHSAGTGENDLVGTSRTTSHSFSRLAWANFATDWAQKAVTLRSFRRVGYRLASSRQRPQKASCLVRHARVCHLCVRRRHRRHRSPPAPSARITFCEVSYRRRLAYNCSNNNTIGSEHRNASYEVFRTHLVELKFGPFADKVYTATNSRFVPRSGSKIPRMRSCRYFIRTTCRSLNQGALEAGGAFACRSTCSRLRGSAAL